VRQRRSRRERRERRERMDLCIASKLGLFVYFGQ
jgi:hypothetical protein